MAAQVKQDEYWLRLATLLHGPMSDAVLQVLHNNGGDPSYVGLPEDETKLYQFFDANRGKIQQLVKINVLKQDQEDLLLPATAKTVSSDFDFTLRVAVIRTFLNLPPPKHGWKKSPPVTDKSKAAASVRGRDWRNFVIHTPPSKITQAIFIDKWSDGTQIIHDLGYKGKVSVLLTMPLDELHALKDEMKTKHFTFEKAMEAKHDALRKKMEAKQDGFKKDIGSQLKINQNDIEAKQKVFESKVVTNQKAFENEISIKQDILENKMETKQDAFQNCIKSEQKIFENYIESKQKALESQVKTNQDVFEEKLLDQQDAFRHELTTEHKLFTNEIKEQFNQGSLRSSTGTTVSLCLDESLQIICNNLDADEVKKLLTRLNVDTEGNLYEALEPVPWKQIKLQLEFLKRADIIKFVNEKTLVTKGFELASQKLREQYRRELKECIITDPLAQESRDNKTALREDIYIDLVVLPGNEAQKVYNNSDRETLMQQKHLNSEASEKSVDKLVKDDDKMIFIRGVAGIGKSTLIDMFTLKWAKNEIDHACKFDFVFKFTCREINSCLTEFNTLDGLFNQKYKDVFEHITLEDLVEHSRNVLVILDGVDELKSVHQMNFEEHPSMGIEEDFMKVIPNLLNLNQTSNHFKTIICGRPKAVD